MQPPTGSLFDLLNLDYCFSQQSLVDSSDFEGRARQRDLDLWPDDKVDALRRAGVIHPLYYFDPASKRRPNSNQRRRPWRLSLEDAYRVGGVVGSRSAVYLYSPYQLLLVPQLRQLVTRIRPNIDEGRRVGYSLRLSAGERKEFRLLVEFNDALVLTLSALEFIYRPRILGKITMPRAIPSAEWDEMWSTLMRLNDTFDPVPALHWLGCDAQWIRNAASRLLSSAERVDPLDTWGGLIRLVRPEKWDQLKGDALVAIDYRAAAEMLLLFYEDLSQSGLAPPLPDPPRYARGEFHGRLKRDDDLDSVLMEFGLSPHPAVVLVIEGESESVLVPRVMDALGVKRSPNWVMPFVARGIDKDIGTLARYVVTPELGDIVQDYAVLNRPPAHFIVVVDPESAFASQGKIDQKRGVWVDEIWRGLSREFRTPAMKKDIESLVHIETWRRGSFEFAHFTDRQIARAILQVHTGYPGKTLEEVQTAVARVRAHRGNLDEVWKNWRSRQLNKPGLADALWPVLERNLLRARERGTLASIPVARVVVRAGELAARSHRFNVAMRLK